VDPPARSDLDNDRATSLKGVARVVEKGQYRSMLAFTCTFITQGSCGFSISF